MVNITPKRKHAAAAASVGNFKFGTTKKPQQLADDGSADVCRSRGGEHFAQGGPNSTPKQGKTPTTHTHATLT